MYEQIIEEISLSLIVKSKACQIYKWRKKDFKKGSYERSLSCLLEQFTSLYLPRLSWSFLLVARASTVRIISRLTTLDIQPKICIVVTLIGKLWCVHAYSSLWWESHDNGINTRVHILYLDDWLFWHMKLSVARLNSVAVLRLKPVLPSSVRRQLLVRVTRRGCIALQCWRSRHWYLPINY
jgi:hypothetical protein